MGRVRIRKLVLHNFRSFKGRHELEFPESGLVILRGENRDTRGDSGAGKTNVLLAIAYAFGFCPIPVKALQCWYTDEPMLVEVYLDTADGPAILTRGAKLTITIGGHLYKGSAKAVEAKLDELCGVQADLREALTYRSQRKPRKFLNLDLKPAERDAAMKDFLVQVLHLEVLDKEVDRAAKALSPLESQGKVAAAQLSVAEAALFQAQADPMLTHQPVATVHLHAAMMGANARVEKLAGQLQEANAQRVQEARHAARRADEANTKVDGQITLLEARAALVRGELIGPQVDHIELNRLGDLADRARDHLRTVQAADDAAHAAYDAKTNELRQFHDAVAHALSEMDGEAKRLPGLRAEAASLRANTCPTCARTWDAARARLLEVEETIERAECRLEEAPAAKATVAKAKELLCTRTYAPDSRLDRLKAVHAQLREQTATELQRLDGARELKEADVERRIAEIQLQVAAVQATRSQATSEELTRIQECVQELTREYAEAQLAFSEHRSTLELARERNRIKEQVAESARERVRSAATQVEHLRREHSSLQVEWKREADYSDLVKSFRAKIFDETLEAIGRGATSVLGTLPNAAHVSVEFKSERTAANGTVQDRITPVTYLHGEERKLEESVNGGALTSIELAVDLAVAQAVSERLGCALNWIVLDEAFNGHDTVTKLACLEMLQQYAADKLVVIVDHNSEFKEMFAQVVTVEHVDKLSRFA